MVQIHLNGTQGDGRSTFYLYAIFACVKLHILFFKVG